MRVAPTMWREAYPDGVRMRACLSLARQLVAERDALQDRVDVLQEDAERLRKQTKALETELETTRRQAEAAAASMQA